MLNFARLKTICLQKPQKLVFNTTYYMNLRQFCSKPITTETMLENEKILKQAKESIYKKTREGVKTLRVMNQVEYTKDGEHYNRRQQYEEFITRMMNLYNSTQRRSNKKDDKDTPLDALRKLFEERRAKGFKAAAFSNHDQHFEIEQSPFMNHLVDEIQYACKPGQFFPPHTMYKTFSYLALLKYKNTELIPEVRKKMLAMAQGKDEKPSKDFDIRDKIYRDKEGRDAKHDVYRGFDDSQEFYSHLETLLNWQSEDIAIKDAKAEVSHLKGEDQAEAQEIVALMESIIESGKEAQNLQHEMAQSIEAVRSQYIQMADAFDKNEFLKENRYIKYDLLQLQEKLVQAGLMDPYESVGNIALETLTFGERMGRATEVFYDLTKEYYPEMAPKLSGMFQFDDVKGNRKQLTLSKVERQNDFTLKYIGLVLGKLAEMRQTVRRDVVDNDFLNPHFRHRAFGNEDLVNPKQPIEDTEHIKLKTPYTRYWTEVTKTFNAMLPIIKQKLANGDNKDLMLLTYGLTSGEITDTVLLKQIQDITHEYLKGRPSIDMPDDQMILSMQGIAQLPFKNPSTQAIVNYLKPEVDKINIFKLDLNQKLRLAWSLSVLEIFDVPKFKEVIDDLNQMPFENAENELLYEELEMIKDIYYCCEYLSSNKKIKITNDRFRMLAKSANDLSSEYPEAKATMDPFKNKVLNGLALSLSELGADSIGNAQNLLSQTATEAAVINKSNYPYVPDLLFSFRNRTIALWVTNRSVYHGEDSEGYTTKGLPITGKHKLHQRVLRKLNPHDNVM